MESFKKRIVSSPPKPREEIEEMNAYSAPLEGRRNFLRLDFNENTIGPSPKVLDAIHKIPPNQISIYPEYSGLREAITRNLNSSTIQNKLQADQIELFNGVDGAIHAIFHAYASKGDLLLTTVPTFGYYNPCAKMQGMKILEVPYEGPSFDFPLNAIKESLIRNHPKILIICNPNNPTGTRTSAKKILELAKASPQTLVVIDELYEAFLGDSLLSVVNFSKTSNLVVLRSLSKTSGLAGLRIGFGISNQEVIHRIKKVTGPYDINSFAVAAAFASLEDQEYTDNYVQEVLKARTWIQQKLLNHGVKHHIDGGNYFLLWPKKSSTEVESSLKAKGILIRNMKNKPFIEGSLRVSIGTTAQMKQFWEALKKSDSI